MSITFNLFLNRITWCIPGPFLVGKTLQFVSCEEILAVITRNLQSCFEMVTSGKVHNLLLQGWCNLLTISSVVVILRFVLVCWPDYVMVIHSFMNILWIIPRTSWILTIQPNGQLLTWMLNIGEFPIFNHTFERLETWSREGLCRSIIWYGWQQLAHLIFQT